MGKHVVYSLQAVDENVGAKVTGIRIRLQD
jgi:hypothetical protein